MATKKYGEKNNLYNVDTDIDFTDINIDKSFFSFTS